MIVLQGHTPFVRHPESEHALEENWLFELITESYLPLIDIFQRWQCDGIETGLALSLTPCLLAMLQDDLLCQRYLRYLEDRIDFMNRESARLARDPELGRLARMCRQRFARSMQMFRDVWGNDLVAAFRHLQDSGALTLLASAATHAYLPLWELCPEIVRLQIRVGVECYQRLFGRQPLGFWLPECGFYAGLDQVLHQEGIRYSFLETHGILHADPQPKYREFAPAHTAAGLAVFGRHLASDHQVRFRDRGYPGDEAYVGLSGDIGFHWDSDYLHPIIHHAVRVPTGIRYYCSPPGNTRRHYDPRMALDRCWHHAEHFACECERWIECVGREMDRPPVIVALFDMEHFGHWWHEGPVWLDMFVRRLVARHASIKIVSAEDYLRAHPTNQVVEPSMSSWGYQGYSETWLMGRNHWIYPAIYKELETLRTLVTTTSVPSGPYRDAMDQLLRELLLAQSSDWAFAMHAEAAQEYAKRRVREHLNNVHKLRRQIETGAFDHHWIEATRRRNNVFESLDLYGLFTDVKRGVPDLHDRPNERH